MLRPSSNLNPDFAGTAAELAGYVALELHRLGFAPRFYPNERLVRYYAWECLLDRPEPSHDGDRRRKLFDARQAQRLLAARILSERGSDLESIRRELKSAISRKGGLEQLIDDIAAVRALEGRDEHEPAPLAEPENDFSTTGSAKAIRAEMQSEKFTPRMLFSPSARALPGTGTKLRRISESGSPGLAFRKMVMLESEREDISDEARALYRQLLAFHPTDPGEPPKRERWSKLRLAPWCEVLLRIDERQRPSRSELDSIVSNFRKSLEDSYMQ